MSRMQRVSLTCEREMSALAWLAPKVLANSGISLKLVMKGLAKPLVICNETPKSIEKMKKMAIFFSLKSEKALKPRVSTSDFFSTCLFTLQAGNVRA